MKCKYVFKFESILQNPTYPSIRLYDFDIKFCSNNGKETIEVEFTENDERQWPEIRNTPILPTKFHIVIRSPRYDEVKHYLRIIQGMLSIYGMHKINLDEPETFWIPEKEEEKLKLKLFSYKRERADIDKKLLDAIPFDILARTVLSAKYSGYLDIPLSFFRKGQIDLHEENYIEAIYNFYFMLEALFSNGKSRNIHVQKEFEKAEILVDAITKGILEFTPIGAYSKRIKADFDKKYKDKSPTRVIENIIELRGFLHHQNIKRRDIWHPEENYAYIADAMLLSDICYRIAFKICEEYVFSESIINEYKKQFVTKNNLTSASTL